MTDALARTNPERITPVDSSALLDSMRGIAPQHAEALQQILEERETLLLLQSALLDVERAGSLAQRLRIFVDAIRRTGFARVVVTLRNESLDAVLIVATGLSPAEEADLRQNPAPGEVWRSRLSRLEPFRVSQSYYLDARDPWIATEFAQGVPSSMDANGTSDWSPQDSLLLLLRSARGEVLATLTLDDPVDRRRPTLSRVRIVELFGQQMAFAIEQARLLELAERRAERLQRLQEIGSTLARTLDTREVHRELARQVLRVVSADGVAIVMPDLERRTLETRLHIVHGVERPLRQYALADSLIADAARTGRPVVANDYASVRPLAAQDDVLEEVLPCGSAVAIPMKIGLRLVAVLVVRAGDANAFSSEDVELLHTVGAQAATALANAELYAESERERRQSEALSDVARAVGESLRLGEVLQLILRHAVALLRAEGACVALREGPYLNVVAAVGTGQLVAGLHIPVESSIAGEAMRNGRQVIVNDAPATPGAYRPSMDQGRIRKTVIVPLITGSGPIGVLNVINRDVDFGDEDARILQRLADHVAVAIVNARLFEEAAEATREWRVAFDAIPIGMALVDEAGRIARHNTSAVSIAGVRPGEAITGRSFFEVVLREHPADLERTPIAIALERGEVARGVVRSVTRGRILELVASPHPSGGAVVTFEDVTQLHALEERHRRVIETTSDAIVITDTHRRIVFANPAAHELFGRGMELLGTPVGDTVDQEHAAWVEEHEARGFAGLPQRYECVVVRSDGDRRIVEVSSAPLRELGEVTGIVASLRDVTDERRARDAVAVSESRYRNLFETATDAIYTIDAHGTFTSANEATCRLLGMRLEDLLGRKLKPYISAVEFETVRKQFTAALGGEPRRYECHVRSQNGNVHLLSVTNTPIRRGETVVGVLGIARDVTRERERAVALARSEARYTRLVESAADAIFTLDEEGHFTSVNRALEVATGRTRESLIGSHFTSLVAGEDVGTLWPAFAATLNGENYRGEFRYRDRDGEYRFGSIITAPIQEEGRVTGGLGVVRDVTEEKRLIEQLVQQEKLAGIGQLVSGVAHELNNPLASVLAFSQLLLAGSLVDDDQRNAAETIQQEAKRAARIVSNLLTFARQHPPERMPTDLNQVLRDTIALRRYALTSQNIEIIEDLDPQLPRTWADPFQLQQVFLNLVTNAEHALSAHASDRAARLAIRTRHEGEMIVARVSDTGPGISSADADRIFNPFFTTKPVGQGTGLGLSISHGIIRQHGGRIRVEPEPGGGAVLVVELPITAAPAVDDMELPAPAWPRS